MTVQPEEGKKGTSVGLGRVQGALVREEKMYWGEVVERFVT
jgi:hypothetical protein